MHVSKGQLEELRNDQVASLPKTTVVSRLRFIPKADSMRPITRVVRADTKFRVLLFFNAVTMLFSFVVRSAYVVH